MPSSQTDRYVLMIGTSPHTKGGISSVVQSYIAAGLFERWNVRYLTTHVEGSRLRKLWTVLRALIGFLPYLVRPPALVHIHIASRGSFWRKLMFVALARLRGIPIVLHVHGGGFQFFYAKQGPRVQSLIRWTYAQADVLVALTARWATLFDSLVPGAHVEVVPNPVDVPEATAHPESGKIVFLGRLENEKGIVELLEAFAEVVRGHPSAVLHLGGLGHRDKVEQMIARLGLAANVRLLGWVDGEKKEALLRSAAIFTLPSHAEGLPVGMLEAMAHAVPVVMTPVGGVTDAMTDGIEGFVVPVGDRPALARALATLLDEPERALQMGRAGRARASAEFSTQSVMARLDAIYARLSQRSAGAKRRAA